MTDQDPSNEQSISRLGKYVIKSELGRGGFATVYRAVDPDLDRDVALKVMHPSMSSDPTFTQRFQREAKALARLRHPNIVMVLEMSEADGRPYIAMDLADGPNLAQYIQQRGFIPWAEALSLFKPVCEALDYAHKQNIVHRDLKPANILIDKNQGPLLTDFGLARLMRSEVDESSSFSMSMSVPMGGHIMGTMSYISPEMWSGKNAEQPADIYALGCIFYEMISGKLLFDGGSEYEISAAHYMGPRFPEQWPEGVPAGIEAVLNHSLALKPEDRYTSPMLMLQALEDLDAQDHAEKARIDQANRAAGYRQVVEQALRAKDWDTAKTNVGLWLSQAPADSAAMSAALEIDKRLKTRQAEAGRQAAQRKKQEETAALRAAEKKTRNTALPPVEDGAPAAARPKRKIGKWLLIGSGVVVLLCIGLFIISSVLNNIPKTYTGSSAESTPITASADTGATDATAASDATVDPGSTEATDAAAATDATAVAQAQLSNSGKVVCLLVGPDGIEGNRWYEDLWNTVQEVGQQMGFESKYQVSSSIETADMEQAAETLIHENPCGLIIVRDLSPDALNALVAKYPNLKFVTTYDIDSFQPAPNLLRNENLIEDHQTAFLLGYLAAGMSNAGVVGVLGPESNPFSDGLMNSYYQGAEYYNNQNHTSVTVLGWNPSDSSANVYAGGWANPDGGKEAAQQLMANGADVILDVTYNTGAAEEIQSHGGVWLLADASYYDSNFDAYKDITLTAWRTNYHALIQTAASQVADGSFEGGVFTPGLQNGSPDLVYINSAVPEWLGQQIDQVRTDIINGAVNVDGK